MVANSGVANEATGERGRSRMRSRSEKDRQGKHTLTHMLVLVLAASTHTHTNTLANAERHSLAGCPRGHPLRMLGTFYHSVSRVRFFLAFAVVASAAVFSIFSSSSLLLSSIRSAISPSKRHTNTETHRHTALAQKKRLH